MGTQEYRGTRVTLESLDILESADIVDTLGVEKDEVIYIKNLIQKSEHMRKIFVPDDY